MTVGAKEDSEAMLFSDCIGFLVLWVRRGYEDWMEYDVFSEKKEMGLSEMVASKRGGEGEGVYYFCSLLFSRVLHESLY